ncbi:MAG: hypothetical protein HY905_22775 [Deltaproteobacteria bacterium]|nr:hypothetical protein [Deltaproteobacteria bacterium]
MGRSRTRWLGWAVVVSCAAFAGSCNPADETPSCGPGTCAGCCLEGTCVTGDVPGACGLGGAACLACGAGQLCTAGACTAAPACGDGTVDDGEECDDGNLDAGDGCDGSCRLEAAADADADADADSDADADADADEAAECSPYPTGPYAFQRVGNILAPMVWDAARSGIDEALAASVASIRCEPGIHSIFLMVLTEVCPVCPERLREINRLKDHWTATGAKWIFLVTDSLSPVRASMYIERYGISFGWRSNDQDNSEGRYAIAQATEYVPWIAVVRTSDMQVRYLETSTTRLDIEHCADVLASE